MINSQTLAGTAWEHSGYWHHVICCNSFKWPRWDFWTLSTIWKVRVRYITCNIEITFIFYTRTFWFFLTKKHYIIITSYIPVCPASQLKKKQEIVVKKGEQNSVPCYKTCDVYYDNYLFCKCRIYLDPRCHDALHDASHTCMYIMIWSRPNEIIT